MALIQYITTTKAVNKTPKSREQANKRHHPLPQIPFFSMIQIGENAPHFTMQNHGRHDTWFTKSLCHKISSDVQSYVGDL